MLQSDQKPNAGKDENDYKTYADRNRQGRSIKKKCQKTKMGMVASRMWIFTKMSLMNW